MRFGVGIPTGCEGMYTPCSFAGREELVVCSQMAERGKSWKRIFLSLARRRVG